MQTTSRVSSRSTLGVSLQRCIFAKTNDRGMACAHARLQLEGLLHGSLAILAESFRLVRVSEAGESAEA